jgi:hypothetical protein
MDIIKKLTELELKINSLENRTDKSIELAFKQIDLLHERLDRIDNWNDKFFEWTKDWVEGIKGTDERQHDLRRKLDMVFYKVFPEVGDAEDTLYRIVDEQRKKPEE